MQVSFHAAWPIPCHGTSRCQTKNSCDTSTTFLLTKNKPFSCPPLSSKSVQLPPRRSFHHAHINFNSAKCLLERIDKLDKLITGVGLVDSAICHILPWFTQKFYRGAVYFILKQTRIISHFLFLPLHITGADNSSVILFLNQCLTLSCFHYQGKTIKLPYFQVEKSPCQRKGRCQARPLTPTSGDSHAEQRETMRPRNAICLPDREEWTTRTLFKTCRIWWKSFSLNPLVSTSILEGETGTELWWQRSDPEEHACRCHYTDDHTWRTDRCEHAERTR